MTDKKTPGDKGSFAFLSHPNWMGIGVIVTIIIGVASFSAMGGAPDDPATPKRIDQNDAPTVTKSIQENVADGFESSRERPAGADPVLADRVTPKLIGELVRSADDWQEESDIQNTFRGKALPHDGWRGIVTKVPRVTGETLKIELRDTASDVMIDVTCLVGCPELLPADEVVINGRLESLYPAGEGVWIIVTAAEVRAFDPSK